MFFFIFIIKISNIISKFNDDFSEDFCEAFTGLLFLFAFWSEPYIRTCSCGCSCWCDGWSCILIYFIVHYWLQAFTYLKILQNKLNKNHWLKRHVYRLLCNRCPIHCSCYHNKLYHQNCSLYYCCFVITPLIIGIYWCSFIIPTSLFY